MIRHPSTIEDPRPKARPDLGRRHGESDLCGRLAGEEVVRKVTCLVAASCLGVAGLAYTIYIYIYLYMDFRLDNQTGWSW